MAEMSQQAQLKRHEKERLELESTKRREIEAQQLQQRRVDERVARENMAMTVDLDTQHGSINYDADM